mgnify:CR=1 FL=1
MVLIPYICLCVVCVLMSVIYTLYYDKKGWQGILVKGLTILSLIIFSMVSANLKSLNSAITLFIPISLALLLVDECLSLIESSEKVNTIFGGLLRIISCVLFALTAMSLAEFSLLGFFAGILLGAGIGLITWGVKKYKTIEKIVIEILTFMAIGFLIGLGTYAVIMSTHLISSILMLVGGILMLAQKMMLVFGEQNKIVRIIAHEVYVIAIIVISCSIYFY